PGAVGIGIAVLDPLVQLPDRSTVTRRRNSSKKFNNAEKWNRTSLAGYVVMGSTGESVMLTPEENLGVGTGGARHRAGQAPHRRHRCRERAGDPVPHQSRRRNRLQGGHGANAALL